MKQLPDFLFVLAIFGVIVVIIVPFVVRSRIENNEALAAARLRTMGNHQITFKTSDSDASAINDYWTADVAGLYHYAEPEMSVPIRLIELGMAEADGNTRPDTWGTSQPHRSAPFDGYWFQVQNSYQDQKGPVTYGVNNTDRFSFVAYPDRYGATGKNVFMISEGFTMFVLDPGPALKFVNTSPEVGIRNTASVLQTFFDSFPANPTASGWRRLD